MFSYHLTRIVFGHDNDIVVFTQPFGQTTMEFLDFVPDTFVHFTKSAKHAFEFTTPLGPMTIAYPLFTLRLDFFRIENWFRCIVVSIELGLELVRIIAQAKQVSNVHFASPLNPLARRIVNRRKGTHSWIYRTYVQVIGVGVGRKVIRVHFWSAFASNNCLTGQQMRLILRWRSWVLWRKTLEQEVAALAIQVNVEIVVYRSGQIIRYVDSSVDLVFGLRSSWNRV